MGTDAIRKRVPRTRASAAGYSKFGPRLDLPPGPPAWASPRLASLSAAKSGQPDLAGRLCAAPLSVHTSRGNAHLPGGRVPPTPYALRPTPAGCSSTRCSYRIFALCASPSLGRLAFRGAVLRGTAFVRAGTDWAGPVCALCTVHSVWEGTGQNKGWQLRLVRCTGILYIRQRWRVYRLCCGWLGAAPTHSLSYILFVLLSLVY